MSEVTECAVERSRALAHPSSYQTPFNDGWFFSREGGELEAVTLPHDAMLGETRSAQAATRSHGGYFPGGRYRYTREWSAPADLGHRRVALAFEGVQGSCEVAVDGVVIGRNANGYDEFTATFPPLTGGQSYTIDVKVDNVGVPTSRWYTGSGMYRPVSLQVQDLIHFESDGVRLRTNSIGKCAEVTVDLHFANADSADVIADVVLSRSGRVAAQTHVSTSAEHASVDLVVEDPALWSAHAPNLYELTVELRSGDHLYARCSQRVGLRVIALDPSRGLLINGESTLLRGGCVHHDNGIIGATTLAAAERRRVQILKEWGYNAVRSAHNPISRSFLEACDELGMYVLDEYTDVWFVQKLAHGLTGFAGRWRGEIERMIAKDRNHPSVVMYSIGNEIPESGAVYGVRTARELVSHVHALDPDRPVTLGVNPLINVATNLGKKRLQAEPATGDDAPRFEQIDHSTAFNIVMSRLGAVMDGLGRTPLPDRATRDVFAELDIAGYNYARQQMRKDISRYPSRFMLGTETMPGDIPQNWALVESSPRVIGDFSWTAWDYLGEAGLGTWIPGERFAPLGKPYPHLISGSGAIDITGKGGAPAQLAKVTWGLSPEPLISVTPLDRSGQPVAKAAWRSTDAVPSWAWRGKDGVPAQVEVYSDADEVELSINGRVVGRKKAGAARKNTARFSLRWEPGELTAVAFRDGSPSGRSTLLSSRGELRLRMHADRTVLNSDGQDAAFVSIEVVDAAGTVEQLADDVVELDVAGGAVLVGFGSAVPATEEPLTTAQHTTYRGRALAVFRAPTFEGAARISARSSRHGEANLELQFAHTGAARTSADA